LAFADLSAAGVNAFALPDAGKEIAMSDEGGAVGHLAPTHLAPTHLPRQPSETVFHRLVKEHLEEFSTLCR
jgi:hypothetical protein